jgi:hypothetical protein
VQRHWCIGATRDVTRTRIKYRRCIMTVHALCI